MKGACIRHTELPSTTRLFADFLYDFDKVSRFYAHSPQTAAIAEAARAVRLEPSRRRALVDALAAQNSDGGTEVKAHLDRLSQPETVVVVTGQQVGLYGGPVFSLYKALTAAKLAAQLTEQGVPAVPVFWLATEDHDLDEVDHGWVFDGDGAPRKVEVTASTQPYQPVGGLQITENSNGRLAESLAMQPYGDEALALARSAYGDTCSFQSGFQSLLRQITEPCGLLFLDPMQAAIRDLASPVIRQAIEQMPELGAALIERGNDLVQAGYHAQVHFTNETSLVFLMEQSRRVALSRFGDVYAGAGGVRLTSDELIARLDSDPESISPNALLRPVVQDSILPTAVYVGGPAELAYLAQSRVIYERILGRSPVILPRASFTVLSARAGKLLERYRLTVKDCLTKTQELKQQISERLIPPNLNQAFETAEGSLARSLDGLGAAVGNFDKSLGAAFEKSRRKMFYQFEKTHRKTARESLLRDERAEKDAEYLSNLIFPREAQQERVYGPLAFIAEYGPGFAERIYENTHLDCHDHVVLHQPN